MKITLAAVAVSIAVVLNAAAQNSPNAAQQPAATETAVFADVTHCQWTATVGQKIDCSPGLSLNGDEPSTISIDGLPPADTISIVVETGGLFPIKGQMKNRLTFDRVPAKGRFARIDVYLPRIIFPRYPTDPGHWLAYNHVADPTKVTSDGNGELVQTPWVVMTYARPIDVTVIVPNGAGGEARHFQVQTRFERWHFDTGGFYALSGARNESLVTHPGKVDANNVAQTDVLIRRRGDRVGPTTGVTFVFHPSNYPDFGWEFGSATGDRPTSWYLGGALRLRTFGDNTLLSISGGLSRISVLEFPAIEAGKSYSADDPRLSGRQHYVSAPYVALGLGVHFGGADTTTKK
jgi:hypothetical protein